MVENDIKNNIKNNKLEVETIKLQRVDKIKSRCSSCHRLRVIKNKELNLCSICDSAKKYWCEKNEPKTENIIVPNKSNNNDTETENEDYQKEEIISYYCDNCNSKIKYGSLRCNNCKTINNWLNTPLVTDTNYLICGSCGAILNLNAQSCFNCGNTG